MKKLQLKLEGKEMLSKEQMKKITGGSETPGCLTTCYGFAGDPLSSFWINGCENAGAACGLLWGFEAWEYLCVCGH
jgi:hypothetical protein